ncbi:conserved unknown protein [Ectocarpus siliculosus]|uniref:Maf-like protein n=1 Tax=Ectocarpus siliculosus TaxID=2880 RepID=D8LLL5_ECTSI|nr:conserved unknown protein [Ectocarpus siliculosus]|eukprot:CBN74646.1 conserved unknown protein [Ectocarpus siliculosus]
MDETPKTDPLGGGGSSLSSQPDVELQVQPRPKPCSLPIVLGSSSGYRRRIMDSLGWEFSTASPDVDEKAIRDPDPRKMCAEIARAKARALAERLDKPAVLITADQVCLFDEGHGRGEEVREKPESVEEAKAFLRSYSCRSVKTLSALCVTNLDNGRAAEGVHESTVAWREISPAVVDDVIARGNVMGSAGGFALEEPGLRSLVDKIEGSVDSVLGLPVELLCTLVERATCDVT